MSQLGGGAVTVISGPRKVELLRGGDRGDERGQFFSSNDFGEHSKIPAHNHLAFTLKYHITTVTVGSENKEVKRIVAFNVKPYRCVLFVDNAEIA